MSDDAKTTDAESARWLAEDPVERAAFDREIKMYGGPLRAMAGAFATYSKAFPPQGSMARMMAIYSNELARAADAAGEPEP